MAASPMTAAASHLADAFDAIRRRPDLADHLAYPPPAGMTAHRQAGAKWLAQSAGVTAEWQSLVVCEGGQHAMALAFASLCKAGDTVMTECATFVGMKALADQLGLRLQGLKMDAEGLMPDALDRAAAAGAKVLYTIPSLQNPTARVMSAKRRADIAAIARKRDLVVVEDDVYAPFMRGDHKHPALVTLMPERTFYIASLSKMVAPGLRCGYLVTPSEAHMDRVIRAVRAFSYAPASFGALIGTHWIETGTAQTIAAAVKRDDHGTLAQSQHPADVVGRRVGEAHVRIGCQWRIDEDACQSHVAATMPSRAVTTSASISSGVIT